MTIEEYKTHSENISWIRKEFFEWWNSERERTKRTGCSDRDVFLMQCEAWKQFTSEHLQDARKAL
jgi:hypothetical protein